MWKNVIAPTALVSVLWVAVSGITTYYLSGVEEQQARNVAANRETVQAADKMLAYLWQLQVAAADEGRRADLAARLAGPEAGFQEAYAVVARAGTAAPESHRLVELIGSRFADYRAALRREAASGKALQQARATADACEELIDLAEQRTAESIASRLRLRDRVNWVRLCFLVAGPALGLLLGFRVSRGMHQTLSQISVTLKDASGDLSQEIGSVELREGDTRDLPGLHQQVQEVAGRIRQVVGELQQARRDILRAERLAAVGELAAGVAHELRNPLTAVKLLIQTEARKAPDRPLNAKYLEIVQHEIGRMENTIQGLLDFARPPRLRRVVHDVRDTLRRALNLARGRADRQHVEIVEHLPDHAVEVNGDPGLLDQVFLNLLLNGIESMPEGGSLRVEIVEEGGEACRVVVSDTGAGIPAPVIDRIFEPFVTTKEHGVGLGLPVSRRVVQEHGGSLEAANRPEGGATFTVRLPLARSAPALHEQPV